MQWPEKPTCHAVSSVFRFSTPAWTRREADARNPNGEPFRRCSHCGSIHPEDLLAALAAGATLQGSDWKYGWPHKFYAIIPNPNRDQQAEIGSSSEWDEAKGESVSTPMLGTEGDFHAKWYNEHLTDTGYDDEALTALLAELERTSGIVFRFQDGKLMYHAPSYGYQA
jgi:hypothetical protein